MHLALLGVLIFGVRWQNRPTEVVSVELWEPPAPVVKPEPPKPVEPPKPEPRVEAPPPPKPEPKVEKPEIVEKAAPPKPKPAPKPEPKVEKKPQPKPEPKPAPLKPRVDETQRFREQLLREQASLAERELALTRDSQRVAGDTKALQTWKGRIVNQIRNRISKPLADAVPGNPKAVFMVTLLPNCEVLEVKKVQSSGNAAYDDEVERAIHKASPLPKPDKVEVFERRLELTFRPKDPL
ncbi:MAG TPA: energy transducer TonB [Burkholderiales bacterium]|nr:energy transducer TonB [Burkholderiales bacterium]